jgi:hypothetical protein
LSPKANGRELSLDLGKIPQRRERESEPAFEDSAVAWAVDFVRARPRSSGLLADAKLGVPNILPPGSPFFDRNFF